MTLRQDGIVLRSEALSAFTEVGHAFTTRIGGVSTGLRTSLNLTYRAGESAANVSRNRATACLAAGAPERLAYCRQVLGSKVVRLPPVPEGTKAVYASALGDRPEADAMVTDQRGVTMMTFSADCNLLLLYDRRRRVIANVHASRPGARGGIAKKAVEAMTAEFGTDPSDVAAVVGPSIGRCCYVLGESAWADWRAWAPQYLDEWNLDLKAANRGQLVEAGVGESSIEVCDLCTVCRADWFYSFRRDGEKTGRFAAMIWIR